MTRWELIIILVVLGGFGPIAQADDDVMLIKQFERVYAGPSPTSNITRGLIPTSDGGFFLIVRGSGKLSAIKTDRNGYVEWQKELQYDASGGSSHTYDTRSADSVKQTADGGYIIGIEMFPGVSTPNGDDPEDGLLIRLDAHGNKLWDVVIGTPARDRISPVEVAPDGGFVAAGFSDLPQRSALLAKVDDNGQLLWKKHYEAAGRYVEDFAIAHGNDGYVLVGSPTLLKTDLQGNTLQTRTFDPSEFILVVRVLPIPGGGYVAAGVARRQSEVLSISHLDDNLETEWNRTYDDYTGVWDLIFGLDVAADGFVVAGNAPFSNTSLSAYVLQLNRSGDIIRDSRSTKAFWQSVLSTADGGYIVSGIASLPIGGLTRSGAYLAKYKAVKKPGYISGSLYGDENLTCSADGNEGPVGYRLVKAEGQENGAHFSLIGGTIGYSLAVPPDKYTVSLMDEQPVVEACGWNMNYRADVKQGAISGGNDFFVSSTCGGTLTLTGHQSSTGAYECPAGGSQTTPCAGYNWTFRAHLRNESSAQWNSNPAGNGPPSSLCFNLPWTLNPGDIIHEATSTCNGWNLSSVSPVCFTKQGGSHPQTLGCFIDLTVKVPAASVPPWPISAAVEAYCGNQRAQGPLLHTIPYNRDQCSCDPNDMQVSPQGCGASGAITGQELTYTVRFQNVGAGSAHDVVIRDSLDERLDPSTLRLVSSSHRVTGMQVEPDNELVIRFDGIELPPEVRDSPGSNGFVVFAIHPKKPYVEGTVIDNGAAIFFDGNPAVMTNKVVNTLYNGGPVPVADFLAVRRGAGFDFSYTGGSTGISYQWNFGANATPPTSTASHPTGVTFSGSGPHLVNLTVDKKGCTAATSQDLTACSDWGVSAFEPPMGKPKQLASVLPVKFNLSFQGQAVTSSLSLQAILASHFGWTPAQGCWPRARILSAGGQRVDLGENERCFRFDEQGKLLLNLKLEPGRFQPAQRYEVRVETPSCSLAPENNFLLVKDPGRQSP